MTKLAHPPCSTKQARSLLFVVGHSPLRPVRTFGQKQILYGRRPGGPSNYRRAGRCSNHGRTIATSLLVVWPGTQLASSETCERSAEKAFLHDCPAAHCAFFIHPQPIRCVPREISVNLLRGRRWRGLRPMHLDPFPASFFSRSEIEL
jgi:hypothetical protein